MYLINFIFIIFYILIFLVNFFKTENFLSFILGLFLIVIFETERLHDGGYVELLSKDQSFRKNKKRIKVFFIKNEVMICIFFLNFFVLFDKYLFDIENKINALFTIDQAEWVGKIFLALLLLISNVFFIFNLLSEKIKFLKFLKKHKNLYYWGVTGFIPIIYFFISTYIDSILLPKLSFGGWEIDAKITQLKLFVATLYYIPLVFFMLMFILLFTFLGIIIFQHVLIGRMNFEGVLRFLMLFIIWGFSIEQINIIKYIPLKNSDVLEMFVNSNYYPIYERCKDLKNKYPKGKIMSIDSNKSSILIDSTVDIDNYKFVVDYCDTEIK